MTAKTTLTRSVPAKTSRIPPVTGKNAVPPSSLPVIRIRASGRGLTAFGTLKKKRAAGNRST